MLKNVSDNGLENEEEVRRQNKRTRRCSTGRNGKTGNRSPGLIQGDKGLKAGFDISSGNAQQVF